MKIVVTIPAYNEQATVGQVISDVPRAIEGIDEIKIVVIDDGSSDGTAAAASQAGATVHSLGNNKGLGEAFSQGIRMGLSLGADIIVNIDADGQFNPKDIPLLVAPILKDEADMVTASRFADASLEPQMPWIKKWGNRRVANIVNNLGGLDMKDVSCGFRAYKRDAALRVTLLGGHTYTHEVILDMAFRGLRIVEVPVKVLGVRKVGQSKVASNVFVYGCRSLIIMLRAFRDYRPMWVFGGISIVFLILTILCGGFVTVHYIRTGAFAPYRFVAFFAGGFGFIALICYITALLAGMLNRLRILQDEQLFLLRKREYDKK
ncbi:MAG: glycosyltransferase family 2 protein [Planctomycetes bacterium HGW-Planctomycetes-1]|nr:MAG: glycosyltransferase family 2 protein [Planctomycetes bacterium HGW-Planctomycetes-1]